MQDVKIEKRPDLALRGAENSPAPKKKDFRPVCYNCSSACERHEKCMLELWLEAKALRALGEK
jgi:hypothetical protein